MKSHNFKAFMQTMREETCTPEREAYFDLLREYIARIVDLYRQNGEAVYQTWRDPEIVALRQRLDPPLDLALFQADIDLILEGTGVKVILDWTGYVKVSVLPPASLKPL